MHTVINPGNANCWCLKAMVDHLRADPLVGHVHVIATAGCLEVDHDFGDSAGVIAVIAQDLRGSAQASNGEVVMVAPGARRVPVSAEPEPSGTIFGGREAPEFLEGLHRSNIWVRMKVAGRPNCASKELSPN